MQIGTRSDVATKKKGSYVVLDTWQTLMDFKNFPKSQQMTFLERVKYLSAVFI